MPGKEPGAMVGGASAAGGGVALAGGGRATGSDWAKATVAVSRNRENRVFMGRLKSGGNRDGAV
jgi:hypothetical protein